MPPTGGGKGNLLLEWGPLPLSYVHLDEDPVPRGEVLVSRLPITSLFRLNGIPL